MTPAVLFVLYFLLNRSNFGRRSYKDRLEHRPDKRLYKEKLSKKCKRKIKAHKL